MSAPPDRTRRLSGLIVHILIGALLIFAGALKLFFTLPKESAEELAKMGVAQHITLIGAGELITGILLIVPLTSSLGVLLTSGFWGGVICFHLTHEKSVIPWSLALLLTWVAAYLREPAMFSSFTRGFGKVQDSTQRPIT